MYSYSRCLHVRALQPAEPGFLLETQAHGRTAAHDHTPERCQVRDPRTHLVRLALRRAQVQITPVTAALPRICVREPVAHGAIQARALGCVLASDLD